MNQKDSYQFACRLASQLDAVRRTPVESQGSELIGQFVWSLAVVGALVLVCWLRGM